ncbi:MAG: hypothetical protein ACI4VK_00980 [Candidatus Coproplasma sp.]
MAICNRTLAIANKLISDIKTIVFVVTIIVNCVFFLFYGYSIYINVDKTVFLIIYSLLAATALINFITYLARHKKEKDEKISVFTRIVRIFRYVINASSLGVSIYQLVQFGATDFNKVLLIVSAVCLLIQIIVELVRVFIERYVDLFTTAFKMDFAILFKIGQVKGTLTELADAPLEALAKKLTGNATEEQAVSETEQYIEELTVQYREDAKEKKATKKANVKQQSEENAAKQRKEIVEHLRTIKDAIFKKKK